MVLNRN